MYGGEGDTTIRATEDTDILRVLKLRLYHWQYDINLQHV